VECATADPEDLKAIQAILARHRLLIDPQRTVPTHGGLLSVMVVSAVRSEGMDVNSLRKEIGPKVLELARRGNDLALWNVAMYVSPDNTPEEVIKVEREGWKATGDARFAATVLAQKSRQGQLKADDPELAEALKQFPESGLVQKVAYDVAARENKITRELLADAAKAEFTRFTSFVAPATVVNRPRAGLLRAYMKQLHEMGATTKPAGEIHR
jgi:hypothetical protein